MAMVQVSIIIMMSDEVNIVSDRNEYYENIVTQKFTKKILVHEDSICYVSNPQNVDRSFTDPEYFEGTEKYVHDTQNSSTR
jgi:hypothetical protein